MLKIRNLTKIYERGIPVLDDINFEVQKGEFVILLGPSGAGKTTILKHIWLEELPTKGEIEFEKMNSAKLKKSQISFWRKKMGIVFQDFKFINSKDVFENTALPLRIRNKREKEIKKKVVAVLDKVDLSICRNLFPQELSAGERQRLALARTMVAEPLIILADEPIVHLDDKSAEQVMNLLKDVNQSGATILMATNQNDFSVVFAHRIVKIEKGRII